MQPEICSSRSSTTNFINFASFPVFHKIIQCQAPVSIMHPLVIKTPLHLHSLLHYHHHPLLLLNLNHRKLRLMNRFIVIIIIMVIIMIIIAIINA